LPNFKEFAKNYKFKDNNVTFFRFFLRNFLVNFQLKRLELNNFKHLTQIFKFTKSTAKFSSLLFESKPNLVIFNKNYLRKMKNFQLKLLKKRFPDNIYDAMQTKKKKTRKKLILIKEGFKNTNDSLAFFNSKKKKNRFILIQKKNLFFYSKKNLFKIKSLFRTTGIKNRYKLKNLRYKKQLKHLYFVSSPMFLGKIYYKKSKKKKKILEKISK
jgi:hypothetical protein